MRVFVTGATGWVGQAVVADLLVHGHQVQSLARSAAKAERLQRIGADVLLATLDDLGELRAAADKADAVIHLAFDHDFSRHHDNAAQDRRAIEALGDALHGSNRPLLVTSGLAMLAPGKVATETDMMPAVSSYPRQSEAAALALANKGVRAATIRFPPSVHGVGETHGFVPILIGMAREKGVSAYIGEGTNRWSAVHVSDAARLYRMVLEAGVTEQIYHAVAEEGIAFREIARTIGQTLGLPVESREPDHFGWFAGFAGGDMPASSARTQDRLGWRPEGPTLLADISDYAYYGANGELSLTPAL